MKLEFDLIIEAQGSIDEIRRSLKKIDDTLSLISSAPELAEHNNGKDFDNVTLFISPVQ